MAYAIAEHVGQALGGDIDTFIELMNDRGREIGAIRSNWTNPHGLHDNNHFTTAYDMALITAELYRNPAYLQIMNNRSFTIPPTNMQEEARVLYQHHQMMWPENGWDVPEVNGGKTGFTDAARNTLVTTADNDYFQLVAVVLNDFGWESYNSTREILEYALEYFQRVSLADTDSDLYIESFLNPYAYLVSPVNLEFDQFEREILFDWDVPHEALAVFHYQGQPLGQATIIPTANFWAAQVRETEAHPPPEEETVQIVEAVDTTIEATPAGGITSRQEFHQGNFPIFILVFALIILAICLFIIIAISIERRRMLQRERHLRMRRKQQRKL